MFHRRYSNCWPLNSPRYNRIIGQTVVKHVIFWEAVVHIARVGERLPRLQIQFRISRSFRPRNLANLRSKIRFWIRRKEHTHGIYPLSQVNFEAHALKSIGRHLFKPLHKKVRGWSNVWRFIHNNLKLWQMWTYANKGMWHVTAKNSKAKMAAVYDYSPLSLINLLLLD